MTARGPKYWPYRRFRLGLAVSGGLFVFLVLVAACTAADAPTPAARLTGAPSSTPGQPVTGRPAPTAIASATPSLVPSSTLAPSTVPPPILRPTATPVPAPALKQLTQGKCCTQPFWSADSRQVYFIDKPDSKSPTGFYAVDIGTSALPKFVSERITFFSSDLQYALSYDTVNATIERVSDGQKWQIRTGGRTVLMSPDHTRVVWNETGQNGPLETRVTNVMHANLDGSGAHSLGSALRGGASAWLDNDRLLMTARPDRTSQVVTLSVFTISTGASRALAMSDHLRNTLPSPGGAWVAYTIVFDKDPALNGLWFIRTNGGAAHKVDFWGSFQWRDSHRIIYVPLLSDGSDHAFYEYDADTGAQRRLIGPADPVFKIANGDWVVSPDGSKIVFLETKDLNLWLWSFQD